MRLTCARQSLNTRYPGPLIRWRDLSGAHREGLRDPAAPREPSGDILVYVLDQAQDFLVRVGEGQPAGAAPAVGLAGEGKAVEEGLVVGGAVAQGPHGWPW
ncbi:hypothetical protein C0Q99_19305 [Streptomyces albidoflavus]|nr:hypothetical protein C0Q99_19305 [Streptomyces albidoflavus]